MGGFDLTDIAGNSQGIPSPVVAKPIQPVVSHQEEDEDEQEEMIEFSNPDTGKIIEKNGHTTIVGNPRAKEVKKAHWDITNSGEQVSAGEVDKAHEDFLKNTDWIE